MTELTDQLLIRTIRLQRVASGLVNELRETLTVARAQIIANLAADVSLALFKGRGQGEGSIAINSTFRAVKERLELAFSAVADSQVSLLQELTSLDRNVTPVALSLPLIMGASLSDWLDKIENDLRFKITAAIRIRFGTGPRLVPEINFRKDRRDFGHARGVDEGAYPQRSVTEEQRSARAKDQDISEIYFESQSNSDIPRDFLLTEFRSALSALEALVRTAIQGVANFATRLFFTQRSSGHHWQQISILDHRTTEICRAYAYKIWDQNFQPVGHNLPFNNGTPRHWYCRSIIVPLLNGPKSDAEITLEPV